jgi:hypothetical protein
MSKIFKLKEDLPLDEDRFGVRRSAGIAKAGTMYELVAEPTPQKKKYKLTTIGEKYPYNLYLRKNDFKRWFEEVES